MFSNAKVGERVCSYTYGWGEICSINNNRDKPIVVKFDQGGTFSYHYHGRLYDNAINQDLFYDEIKVEIPESAKKPKVEWKFPCYGRDEFGDVWYITGNRKRLIMSKESEIGQVIEGFNLDDFTPCTLEAKDIE